LSTLSRTLAVAFACTLSATASAVTPTEVLDAMTGDYATDDTVLHAAPVSITGSEGALYLELTENDAGRAVQQFILTLRSDEGEVIARLHGIPPVTGVYLAEDVRALAFGLWAAPDLFPTLEPGLLDPIADATVAVNGSTVEIEYKDAPTNLDGAFLLDASMRFTPDGASWSVRGADAGGGERGWSRTHTDLKRVEIDPPVRREDSGLVVVTLRTGEGSTLDEGDKVALHFEGMLDNGSMIDSTRFPQRSVYAGPYPGRLMPGLAEGLRGVSSPRRPEDGGREARPLLKLIIPPSLGLGERGNEVIPPNATLYYNVVVESVLDARPLPGGAP